MITNDVFSFSDHLIEMMEKDRPAWDSANEYHADTVDIYYIDFDTCGYVQVNASQSLAEILQSRR